MADEEANDDYARLLDAATNGMDRQTAEEIARAALREQSMKENGLKEYGPWPRTTMVTEVGRSGWSSRLRWFDRRKQAE